VPDLATSLPHPVDGGRTYVFTVRPGVRYSDGATVKASDFVRGTRRALLNRKGNPSLYSAVVGAKSCLDNPGFPNLCDISRGVVADDATGRVTFHLETADPEFLAKLTMFVVATPEEAPLTDMGFTPMPSTGPYRITHTTVDGALTLERNPYFVPWSFAAQPSGYADTIVRQVKPSEEAAVTAVLSGVSDVVTVLDPTPVAESHPAQLVG